MEIDDPNNPMLYVSFNQTASRICVGTKAGFLIYSIDPFKCIYKLEVHGGCSIVDILEETPLVVAVGTGVHPTSPRRLVKVYNMEHSSKNKEICRFAFETPVLSVKMNRKRIVVVLEAEIHLYNIENLCFFTKISTCPNPKGLCALSSGTSGAYPMLLAYPSTRGSLKGDLIMYDPISLERLREITDVHDHPLRSVHFSPDGRLVATASQAGTLVKVLPISERETDRYTFRRGIVQSADITAIAFNKTSTLLAVSSSNGTVHIFNVKEGLDKPSHSKSTMSILGDWVWGEETRSFATVKFAPGINNLVSFSNDSSRVYTITQDGVFSQWQLDKHKSTGWTSALVCKLVREDLLVQDFYCGSTDDEQGNLFVETQ